MSFLKSKEYRDISLFDITNMSELDVIQKLAEIRWGSSDKQQCPAASCGAVDAHYWRERRKQWRCRKCRTDFSVTSKTAFSHHKKSLRTILTASFLFSSTASGISTIELGAQVGMTPKANWYLQFKFREALVRGRNTEKLDGVVQVDGGYFGGKRRDVNNHGRAARNSSDRDKAIKNKVEGAPTGRQRRWRQFAPGGKANAERRKNRRVILVLRELFDEKKLGARRTIVTVARSENDVDAVRFVRKYVTAGSVIMSDECPAYSPLSSYYDHLTVQHSMQYVKPDGTNDNQAESYMSRVRRAEYGVHHRFTPLHLFEYAQEKAWREDCRRQSLGKKMEGLVRLCLTMGKSIIYRGYWQGHRLEEEVLNI